MNWHTAIYETMIPESDLGIHLGVIKNSLANKFHERMPRGAALRALTADPLHQINWETPYYQDVLSRFLSGINRTAPVLDLGCGDGRFTKMLLSMGFSQVVCMDSDYRLLESIHQFAIAEGFRDKLHIVHADADELPFKMESFGAVLAIGVLYYLNEKQPAALAQVHQRLQAGGILILSEPDLESMMFRSLIFETLEDTLAHFEERTFTEVQGDTPFKFGVKSIAEMQTLLESIGFQIQERKGITMFHNLLRILFVRGGISREQIETNLDRIKHLFDFLHEEGSLSKHQIWKCLKA
jgi:SAM-dependent methyltransferase